MKIATYNIRVTKVEDVLKGRAFIFRLPRILRNIKKVNPDVIAFQEVQRLHIFCLRLFLYGYKIGWSKFEDVNGGNAVAVSKKFKALSFSDISVPTKRTAASVLLKVDNVWINVISLHLSLSNNKLNDIIKIIETSEKRILVGDFNVLADDDNHVVFKYLKDEGYKKLNENQGGFHGYGDADKTPTTVDNFFTNFGELENIEVIEDFKASDHNLMYIDLKI